MWSKFDNVNPADCLCQLDKVTNCSVMSICRSSLLNQKHNVGWFPLKKFVDLFRVCCLHIISRNHSNRLLLINLQKKTCPKKAVQQRLFVLVLGL